ncbi:MAG: OmpA family protein [Burkholderiales bacterium]
MNTSTLRIFFVSLLIAVAGPLWAQAAPPEKVLKGKEVTPEALVDALALPPEAAPPRTRGLRPVAAPESSKPAKPSSGRANLQVTFLTNSTQLTPEAEEVLGKLAQAMKSEELAAIRFMVQGHADARGDAQANMLLSKARAEAVAAHLTSRHGIAAERLQSEGRGSAEPLNKERVDAPENRRVTVISQRP